MGKNWWIKKIIAGAQLQGILNATIKFLQVTLKTVGGVSGNDVVIFFIENGPKLDKNRWIKKIIAGAQLQGILNAPVKFLRVSLKTVRGVVWKRCCNIF